MNSSKSHTKTNRILVLRRDGKQRKLLSFFLMDQGFEPRGANSLEEAMQRLKEGPFDLAIVDMNLPEAPELEGVEKLRAIQPRLPIVVMAPEAPLDTIIRAIRLGISDLIEDPNDISGVVKTAREILSEGSSAEVSEEELAAVDEILEQLSSQPETSREDWERQLRAEVARLRRQNEEVQAKMHDLQARLHAAETQPMETSASGHRELDDLRLELENLKRERDGLVSSEEQLRDAMTEAEARWLEERSTLETKLLEVRQSTASEAPSLEGSTTFDPLEREELESAKRELEEERIALEAAKSEWLRQKDELTREARDLLAQAESARLESPPERPVQDIEEEVENRLFGLRHALEEEKVALARERQKVREEEERLQAEIRQNRKEAELHLREYQTKVKEEELALHVEQAKFREEMARFEQARRNFQEDLESMQARQRELSELEQRLQQMKGTGQCTLGNDPSHDASSSTASGKVTDSSNPENPNDPKTWCKPPASGGRGILRIGRRS